MVGVHRGSGSGSSGSTHVRTSPMSLGLTFDPRGDGGPHVQWTVPGCVIPCVGNLRKFGGNPGNSPYAGGGHFGAQIQPTVL